MVCYSWWDTLCKGISVSNFGICVELGLVIMGLLFGVLEVMYANWKYDVWHWWSTSLCFWQELGQLGALWKAKMGEMVNKLHTLFSFIIFSCNLEKADSLRVAFAATRLFRWTKTFHWIQHEHDVSNMVSCGSYFLGSSTQKLIFLCSFPSHESSQEASTIDRPSYQVRIRLWKYVVYLSIVLKC